MPLAASSATAAANDELTPWSDFDAVPASLVPASLVTLLRDDMQFAAPTAIQAQVWKQPPTKSSTHPFIVFRRIGGQARAYLTQCMTVLVNTWNLST
jgi:hypothetical protein